MLKKLINDEQICVNIICNNYQACIILAVFNNFQCLFKGLF